MCAYESLAADTRIVCVARLNKSTLAMSRVLQVRRSVDKISLPMVLELIEGINWGTAADKLPPSEAKNRLALVTAAKAVALALTPGVDEIKQVTLWSGRRGLGPSVDFITSDAQLRDDWHPEEVEIMGWKKNFKVCLSVLR